MVEIEGRAFLQELKSFGPSALLQGRKGFGPSALNPKP